MPTPYRTVALDAWPVVAAFAGYEPARSELNRLLEDPGTRPVISAVNFAEACYSIARISSQSAAAERAEYLRGLLNVNSPDDATAEAAGWIKYAYRVSLGDSFAAAIALKHDTALWTGDPELLCSDRVWSVRDMRAPQDRTPPSPHRRHRTAHLSNRQIASIITAPLHLKPQR